MQNMGRKIVSGSASRLAQKFLRMGTGLILMPILIGELGGTYYGIWAIALSVLGYQGILDLGLTSAVARFLSKSIGKESEEDFRRYLATSFYILSGIGLVMMVGVLFTALAVQINTPEPSDAQLYFGLIIICGINLCFQFPMRVFLGLLTSHVRFDMISWVGVIATILRFCLFIAALVHGYGILMLAAFDVTAGLIATLIRILFSLKIHKNLSLNISYFSLDAAKEMLSYGYYSLISRVADMLRFHMGHYLLAFIYSAALVTPYEIAYRLTQIVAEMTRAMIAVLMPVFSQKDGSGDTEGMKQLFLFSTRISSYVSILMGGMMWILCDAFIERWQGIEYLYVSKYLKVLMIATVTAGCQYPTVGFLFGTSRNKLYAATNVVHGIITFVLSLILIKAYRIEGLTIAIAVPSVLIKFFVQPMLACKALDISPVTFFARTVFSSVMIPLVYVLLVNYLIAPFIEPTYYAVIFLAIASCCMFLPYIFFVGFNREHKKLILELLISSPSIRGKTGK